MDDVPGIMAIDHVGVAVADLDAAIAFYTDTLGLVLLHHEVNAEQAVAEAMLGAPQPRTGGPGTGGPGTGGAEPSPASLQLVAPMGHASPLRRFLDRAGPGLQHLAYRVGDVDLTCARLRHRGLRLLYDQAQRGTKGSRINFIHPQDTGGVLVELVEPCQLVADGAPGGTTGRPPQRPREDPR